MLHLGNFCFSRTFTGETPFPSTVHPVRVALIGDSLSTGFHVSSALSMLARSRSCKRNWVFDDRGDIDSVFERLIRKVPTVLHYFAYVSADVSPRRCRSVTDWIIGSFHMCHQVDRILALKRFPEIILLWIGHNNLDWVESSPRPAADALQLEQIADATATEYAVQLGRILDAALRQQHQVTIVVFALVSFESFFRAREKTEGLKKREPSRYPYLEGCYRYFKAMQPEFRHGMVQLANSINVRLKALVGKLEAHLGGKCSARVTFSTALHDAPITEPEMLCDVDAWHPSPLGHRVLAQSAFPVIYEQVLKQRSLQ